MNPETAVVYYDDKKELPRLRGLYPQGDLRYVKDSPDATRLAADAPGTVVFALANEKLQAVTALCRSLRGVSVYVIPGGLGFAAAPLAVDVFKPRLDYVETEITRVCNLNCRGCCDYSNLAQDDEIYYDLDRFTADLTRMKTLFWGIAKIRIMGGEPLLNPRVAEYVETARRIFPDCDLRVVTNGLLLPSVSTDTLRRIGAAGCSFDISNYPPTAKKKKEILAALHSAGVSCNFSVPMRYFFRNLRVTPAGSPAPAFNNCIFTHCHMLGNGRLAPCSFAFCTYRFNRRFGAAYPEDDLFDIYDPALDGWRVIEAFSAPHPFCRYCGSGIIPIRWKGHCPSPQARESDWQIKDTFINTVIAPQLQSAVKKTAVALRAQNQKKN